ncbi:MAG: hypothetical protein E3J72_22290 [Planctomycetota bacterium]|nr:MAG: hypothetical protein E3J72_22290 [Planctomycetota bacterium]
MDNWARYRHIWVDPKDGFDYLIYLRELYASHGRNPGPDQTWPISFGWSDALAGDAQAEAERLAAGGSQKGTPYASMSERAFYLDGINTSKYTYSGLEKPSDWCERNGGWEHHENPIFPFTNCNTMFRLYFCYHDPGGAGPVLTKMGVGMAMSGEDRWWVIVLGP